ncbi:hypothetical protein T4B_5358 [Trichinella pseudospiralis]|uniref:Uncharacterized protein n=1 Tax=Trichinella pseudospiralis TaxID=6337 RepID=A0A0V1J893_TRIPS|nr:hypothetical protein T4E_6397 [Trichinella pseudospiralis]KRY75065.1 hypothetical protein T4A_12852 [Trichinella pseudospiralis]KRZ31133.1 hypothetical protein T4B_5358 [Trichinella pseudospiralis]KRZ43295.1 hypothetical protein T4C_9696 [Trichinella pseudospiralis]
MGWFIFSCITCGTTVLVNWMVSGFGAESVYWSTADTSIGYGNVTSIEKPCSETLRYLEC